jgi:signal transduction histidine kinase
MFKKLSHKIYAYFVAFNLVISVLVIAVVFTLFSRYTNEEIKARFDDTVILLDQQLKNLADLLTGQGLVQSRAPRLLAAVSTGDHGTVLDVAQIFRDQIKSNLFTVIDDSGVVLARVHEPDQYGDDLSGDVQITSALNGENGSGLLSYQGAIYQVVYVPLVSAGQTISGVLRIGFHIDDEFAGTLKRLTRTDITFVLDDEIVSSSLENEKRSEISATLRSNHSNDIENQSIIDIEILEERFRCTLIDLPISGAKYLIQRSIDNEDRFFRRVRFFLLIVGLSSFAFALLVSIILARGIAGPIRQLADLSSKVADGNLDVTFKTQAVDEIGDLSNAFNFMTERLRTYLKELENHRHTLEIKVEERTRELETANAELERASTAKSEFLANMSHELRTPLTAIIGFSEVLSMETFGELNDQQKLYLNDIYESGTHLLKLINDILDLSKIEAGKMEMELTLFRIDEMIESSLIMVKDKCHNHGISLNLNIDESLVDYQVSADNMKLKQVMFNLLSNAAKFTPDGGSIDVNAGLEGENIMISVADSGIGISKENIENVFGEFYQVKGGTTDKTPGTGLGLPITKRIIEMHGGKIWAESGGDSKGSTFTIEIPREVPEVNA